MCRLRFLAKIPEVLCKLFFKFQKLAPILSGIEQLKFYRFARKDLVKQEIKCSSQTNFSLTLALSRKGRGINK